MEQLTQLVSNACSAEAAAKFAQYSHLPNLEMCIDSICEDSRTDWLRTLIPFIATEKLGLLLAKELLPYSFKYEHAILFVEALEQRHAKFEHKLSRIPDDAQCVQLLARLQYDFLSINWSEIYPRSLLYHIISAAGTQVTESNVMVNNETPLIIHCAKMTDDVKPISCYLNSNCAVGDWLEQSTGRSALHYTVRSLADDAVRICRGLFAKGCDLHLADQVGCTPLHYAAQFGRPETVQLLLELGANPCVTSLEAETPLSSAQRAYHNRVVPDTWDCTERQLSDSEDDSTAHNDAIAVTNVPVLQEKQATLRARLHAVSDILAPLCKPLPRFAVQRVIMEGDLQYCTDVQLAGNGRFIVYRSQDRMLAHVFDTTLNKTTTLRVHGTPIVCHPEMNILVSLPNKRAYYEFNLLTGERRRCQHRNSTGVHGTLTPVKNLLVFQCTYEDDYDGDTCYANLAAVRLDNTDDTAALRTAEACCVHNAHLYTVCTGTVLCYSLRGGAEDSTQLGMLFSNPRTFRFYTTREHYEYGRCIMVTRRGVICVASTKRLFCMNADGEDVSSVTGQLPIVVAQSARMAETATDDVCLLTTAVRGYLFSTRESHPRQRAPADNIMVLLSVIDLCGVSIVAPSGTAVYSCTERGLVECELPSFEQWSPESHRFRSESERAVVRTVLMCAAHSQQGVPRYPQAGLSMLPQELVLVILANVFRLSAPLIA